MEFLFNKRPFNKENKPTEEGYVQLKEPNAFIQMIAYFLIAMVAIWFVAFLKENVFHIKTRQNFSMVEAPYVWMPLIKGVLTVLVVRFILKFIIMLIATKGKGVVTGFSLWPPSIFTTTRNPLSKITRIISLLAPYFLLTVIFLVIHMEINTNSRRPASYYWQFLPYLNAAFSCGEIYAAILIGIKAKKGTLIKEWNVRYFEKENPVLAENTEKQDEISNKEESSNNINTQKEKTEPVGSTEEKKD